MCLVLDCLALLLVVTGLGINRTPDTRRQQHLVRQRPPMRQIGTDRCGSALPIMNAKDAGHLAERDGSVRPGIDDRAQCQRMTETQQCVAPMQQRREELARASDDIPVLGKQ